MIVDSIFLFSHFLELFPQIEHEPLDERPPHDPERGFLLKITPNDIPVNAIIKIMIPKNISTYKINVISA
tara:strand:+ start:622 stop:831 length:210 start_codon:yes stop_codon:yes gene_type:complete